MNSINQNAEHNTVTAAFDVEDQLDLLEEMIADEKSGPKEFRATNFWGFYEERFLPELKRDGLRAYRARRNSVLENFFATSLKPESHIPLAGPRWLPDLLRRMAGRLRYGAVDEGAERQALFNNRFNDLNMRARAAGLKPLSDISTSLAGRPEDFFTVNGHHYTFATLYYYAQYIWAAQKIDFSKIQTVVELGSGPGFFAEILKKLHPHLTLSLFDLSPQLYVCSAYLKAALGNQLLDYRAAKKIKSLLDQPTGTVGFYGAYRFPMITENKVDLFWNSASFQEMEPEVVHNYLSFVRRSCQHVYLRQMAEGQLQSPRSGELGVLKKTRYSDYVNALREYDLVDVLPSWLNCPRYPDFASIQLLGYLDSVWIRRVQS